MAQNVTKEKITYGSECKENEVEFGILGKVHHRLFLNVKVITGELQHNLVVVDEHKIQKIKQSGRLNIKNEM